MMTLDPSLFRSTARKNVCNKTVSSLSLSLSHNRYRNSNDTITIGGQSHHAIETHHIRHSIGVNEIEKEMKLTQSI